MKCRPIKVEDNAEGRSIELLVDDQRSQSIATFWIQNEPKQTCFLQRKEIKAYLALFKNAAKTKEQLRKLRLEMKQLKKDTQSLC